MKINRVFCGFPVLAALLLALPSWGAAIKVKKAKGKSAVVVFQGMSPETGEVYQIGDREPASEGRGSGDGSRDNILGVGGGFVSASGASAFGIGGRYGWNKKTMEYGAIFAFLSGRSSVPNMSISSEGYQLGGFFDYNFTPNRAGENGIPAAVAEVTITSAGNSSLTTIALGGGYKWFGLGTSTCIRGDALFMMLSGSGASGSVIGLQVGLQTYF